MTLWATLLAVTAVWLTGLATMITTALLVARILASRYPPGPCPTCRPRHAHETRGDQ